MLWKCLGVWGRGPLLDRPCIVFQRTCVLCLCSQCASECCFHRFCLCYCMLEVIISFKSLRAGSHVFALLMLFLCVILHTMWSGKSLHLQCILPLGMLCLSAISMLLKIYWPCVCWWVWSSEQKRILCLPCILSSQPSCSW